MKTKDLWFVMAAAAMLTGMTTLVSCSEDDEPLPEVIESEVYDEGMAEDVTAEVGTESTKLSYESWIMVRGQTRASFDNRVSVTLYNEFANPDSIIEVPTFELGEYENRLVDGVNGTREEGFVSISDSILRYEVVFRDFSFSYDLYHEVAIYDDGITQQTMPYHEIRNIRDHGYTLTDMDFLVDENNSVFIRKQLDHSITIEFNGQDYDLTAKIELRYYSGSHPAVVASRLIDSGINYVTTDEWNTIYTAWADVEHEYSDGSRGTVRHNTEQMMIGLVQETETYKELPDANLELLASGFAGDSIVEPTYSVAPVNIGTLTRKFEVNYNYFTLSCEVVEPYAYYYDGIIRFDFPCLKYTNVSVDYELKLIGEYVGVSGRHYNAYILTQEITGSLGEGQHVAGNDVQIIVYLD